MSTTPVTLDLSTFTAFPAASTDQQASALQGAVSYGVQQDPVAHAKLLDLQKRLGIPPVVSQGNEPQVKQLADVNSINYPQFAAANPRTTAWASDPDNAAVSGVDELHRVAGIEQNAAAMRPPSMTARTPSIWDTFKDKINTIDQAVFGKSSQAIIASEYENPLTRSAIDVAGGAAGLVGNVGSFFGWHGDDATKRNLLQRIESSLSPEENTFSAATFHKSNAIDWLAANVAPMVPAVIASGGTSLLADTLGVSKTAAKVLAGLTVGGVFDADQAGKTYTAVAGSGGSDYDARLAAYRVAAIGAIPNALFGATDVVPLLRDNPLLTSLGLGSLTGASGQIGQNVVTGQPWTQGVPSAMAQGAAMQGGLHVGMGMFGGHMAQAVDAAEQSKLRERSPDKFYEAMQTVFDGDQSLRIPSDQFSSYFTGKGMDPSDVAKGLGSTNYAEAVLSGGDVEVPPADFLSKLDPEYQKALLPHIVDPSTGLTPTQHQEGVDELEQWATGGGADKLVADTAAADAETASSPEFQAVKEQFRQQHIDAGETPEVAESQATNEANAYSNMARNAGMKPSELLALYNPKVVTGETPTETPAAAAKPDLTNPEYKALHEKWYEKLARRNPDWGVAKLNREAFEWADSEWGSKYPAPTGDVLHQSSEDGPLGWYRRLPDGTIEIGRTGKADLSTDLHEWGHSYLDIMHDLSKRDGASDTLKDDYQKSLDFIGAKDGEPRTREQNENWAKATLRYLREGKAPSKSLNGVFQRFSIWLSSIYKKADDLGVELTPEIRGVFDRLYAAEEGVDRAASEEGPKLFNSAEDAGWTDEQFQKYADAKGMEVEQAKAEILSKLNEAALRDKTEAWLNEEKNVKTAVTENIDQSPVYTAIRSLRRGSMDDETPLTMSKDALVKQFGEERVKSLQKQHPALYRNEGGIDPETAAEMLGFDSAERMMQAMEASPRRSAAIEATTREYMTAKHGDIRYDGSLQDKSTLALMNDKRAENLHRELDALNRRNNPEFELREAQRELQRQAREQAEDAKQQRRLESRDQRIEALKQKVVDLQQTIRESNQEHREGSRTAQDVAPIAAYREAAHQMVESKAVADLQPTRYLDASRKYSREAIEALAEGDYEGAKQAKHKELMNHFLFREATKGKEYIGKVESYVKRMQTKGVQANLGKAGSDYRDQFNRILGRYSMGPAVQTDRSLADWTQAQFDAMKEPAIDPAILNEARNVNYRDASVSEIRLMHDALINVRKLAMLDLGMVVNGRKVDFASAVANMVASARANVKVRPEPVFEEDRAAFDQAHDLTSRVGAPLVRPEFLMRRLDGGPSGPWHDNLFNLSADAQGVEHALQKEVTGRIGDAMENMPKEQRDRLLDKLVVPGIDQPITRKRMISMAMNMGNDGNLDRLQKTFVSLGMDPGAIDHIKGMLTREEWQHVQDNWDLLKPLGKAQAELERRMTGLPPVMVTPTPLHITLADGSEMHLEGGYFPIVMDAKRSERGAQQDAATTAQNLVESGYTRAATSRGNMKERTGFGGPLLLDYEQVLTQHIAKVTKDISHREFILAANKLMMDPQIRQTLRETVGPGYEAQMMPRLRTLINDRNGSTVQGLGDLSNWMQKLRTNVVQASLGFKASTLLLQLTHASSVFLHTSPASYAQSMIDFMAKPAEMTEQIRNLSPNEMANRGEYIDRDAAKLYQDKISGPSKWEMVGKAGMFPVRMMDHVLSFPLWLSVYRDALAENAKLPEESQLSDSEAKYQAMQRADGAVRTGLGSNGPKDLPAIMRKNDFWKMITTLGGFHNLKLNQILSVGNDFARNKSVGSLTYGMMMAAIIPAVAGAYISGRRPKDDENDAAWAAKRALLFAPETVPILGDALQGMENKGDVRFTPLMDVAEKGVKAGFRAGQDKEDKDWTGIGLDSAEVAGDLFGVTGTSQAAKTARYARRVQAGNIDDPNFWDAIMGAPHK